MKKTLLLICFSLAGYLSMAQEKTAEPTEKKNIVKLNLFALPLKNISLQYERAVSRKISVAGTFRLMPNGSIPFKNAIKNAVNDPETEQQIDGMQVGNFAIMPEVRFYLSRKGVFHGFYIAPFASIARYKANLPYIYDDNGTSKTMPLAGSVNTFTGGLMFGAQWKLGKSVYLDWWIFGPNYGSSNGKMSGQKSLTPDEQSSLKADLDKLNIPLTKTTNTVDANGATLNFKGPWGGVRSGLCIGFRF